MYFSAHAVNNCKYLISRGANLAQLDISVECTLIELDFSKISKIYMIELKHDIRDIKNILNYLGEIKSGKTEKFRKSGQPTLI